METLRLLHSVVKSVESIRNMVKESNDLQTRLSNGLEAIKCELALLSAEVKKVMEEDDLCTKPEEWILQLQDLAYDIEDFIVKLGRDPETSAPVRVLQAAMLTDPSSDYLSRIIHFKELIEKIRARKENPGLAQQNPSTAACSVSTSPMAQPQPLNELVGLLLGADGGDGHQNQLKVISIMGRGGLGKTTLAQALCEDRRISHQFFHRAMVGAPSSMDHVSSTLHEIVQQCYYRHLPLWKRFWRLWRLGKASNRPGYHELLENVLLTFLRDKRYLVIIDGVEQRQVWDAIRAALPDNEEGSRVVVTTSMRSVATGCSAGSYLYPMCGLNKEQSADLFWAKLGPDRRQPALEEGLRSFFDRCDGLPLALVDTAHYLRNKGTYLNVDDCKDVSDALGSVLAREEHSFQGTRRTLARCCGRVREHDQKMCMLSVGSFPYGHQINRKRLIRRWMAEGLVSGDFQLGEERVASNCLGKLLDLGIVEPVPCGGGSTKVKRCQVHGVMLEFLVHRSMSWNFITLINKDRIVRNHHTPCAARRLSVYGSTNLINRSQAETIGLSRIRSLTICDTGTDSPMTSFRSCELLRVLDLEGCNWLLDGHLGDICGLLYLKYLSLRGTGISEIPSSIKDLHSLETLDVRDTDVAKLPMEVIKLPMITHLFGEFELPAELGETKRAHDLREFFSHESKLQTLSGFKIVSNNQGFQLILQHASKLRKVKIWCEIPTSSSSSTPPSRPKGLPSLGRSITGSFKRKKTKMVSNVDNLPGSLVSSLETRFKGSDALVSLSVDFGGLCQNFLHRVLQDPCAVSSIKVRGQMKTLPASPTLKKLRYIKEMHLCDTGMPCEELSRLQNLDCLVYLKLAEVREDCCWEGSFVVEADGFRSLEKLCFHGQKPLPYLEFQQGAKSPLISLQLICNMETANELLGVTGIIHLQHLGEVILHSDSPQQKVDAWKREALRHKNRPCIVKRQPGGQAVYNR